SSDLSLLRYLFQGRSDVYDIRFESKDGRKGYMPALQSPSGNSDRQRGNTRPLTKQALIDHISGKRTVGINQLLKNNTCYFLAIDFNKGKLKVDVSALTETCRMYHIPHHIEMSRSGNGAHIWIFFTGVVLAKTARNLGMLLLKETKK